MNPTAAILNYNKVKKVFFTGVFVMDFLLLLAKIVITCLLDL